MDKDIETLLQGIQPTQGLQPHLDLHTIQNQDSALKGTVMRIKKEVIAPAVVEIKTTYKSVLSLIPRAHKIIHNNKINRMLLGKKIAMLCARELKRAMTRTGRLSIQTRAKKLARSMIGVGKESSEPRKRREEADKKKKELEFEEQIRQEKKLDFLINQTDLYAHFVLNKSKSGFNSEKRETVQGTVELKNKLDEGKVEQPKILKATLKGYQMKGLNWLVNLYNNGINGILADDMGLGKTVQSIAFLAYLFEKGHNGPFLIISPTSTLPNWASELERFIPEFTVTKYYGSDRKKLRFNSTVVLTSYSIFCLDEKQFSKHKFQYLILDEAQAIKSNKSMRWNKLLKIRTKNRLLLTGTPIQNNLKELWALLHFIMPTLFDSLGEFEEWFFKMNENQLDRLHLVLKPFMLRREKKEVIKELVDKKIMIVYVDLSPKQRVMYNSLFRSYEDENLLMQYRKVCNHPNLHEMPGIKTGYSLSKKNYLSGSGTSGAGFSNDIEIKIPSCLLNIVDDSSDINDNIVNNKYNHIVDNYMIEDYNTTNYNTDISYNSINDDYSTKRRKIIKNIYGDVDSDTIPGTFNNIIGDIASIDREVPIILYEDVIMEPPQVVSELEETVVYSHKYTLPLVEMPDTIDLVRDSGKLEALDVLLDKLRKEGHRALIYFQMTKMMNIMEQYLEGKKYDYIRLDGSTKINDRRELVKRYQTQDIFLFLLSTRAGGLGINLTAADTVIFYDSDWNPTVDKQAMDRAHRLGQKNRVTVYKFVCRNTVEERVLEMAVKKDEMQKLVIEKGDFVGADI